MNDLENVHCQNEGQKIDRSVLNEVLRGFRGLKNEFPPAEIEEELSYAMVKKVLVKFRRKMEKSTGCLKVTRQEVNVMVHLLERFSTSLDRTENQPDLSRS